MSTTHPPFTARNQGPALTIFDLLADMPKHARWLPGSGAFDGTIQVLRCPARLGTTYLDAGPIGQRPDSGTQFDPPQRIAFQRTNRNESSSNVEHS
jgi:hypothetical protein